MLPNMKNLCFFLLVFVSQILYAQNDDASGPAFDYKRDFKNILARTKNKQDTLFYLKLLNRFQENDSTLTPAETLALMIGYTDSRFFKPYTNMQTELEIIKLNDKAFYLDALDESKEYLRTHPLSLSINKERSFAYYMLKKRDSAKYYMRLADKIMEAMIYSGKGRTPESAYFSLGLVDGDYFIPNVGLSIWGKKTGMDKHRHYLYEIDAVSLEDVHKTYYFNIQHAKQKMDLEEDTEQLAKEKKPKKKRGFYDPGAINPDSLPVNPADSIILPLNERPKIDSAKIRDSLLRIRNISDSLRYDSIFNVCKADSIKAAILELEKAIADSLSKEALIRMEKAITDSISKANQLEIEKTITDSISRMEKIQSGIDSAGNTINALIQSDSATTQIEEQIPKTIDSIPSSITQMLSDNKDSVSTPPATQVLSDSSRLNKELPETKNDVVPPSIPSANQSTENPSIPDQNDSTAISPTDSISTTEKNQMPAPAAADSVIIGIPDSSEGQSTETINAAQSSPDSIPEAGNNPRTIEADAALPASSSSSSSAAAAATEPVSIPKENTPVNENSVNNRVVEEIKNSD